MTVSAIYRIRLQGALDESWQHYLGAGWTIEVDDHRRYP
jgi:hypothetical protein